ncbi:9449_t:CDS:2 [Ambispora gerdemannii]|uniref:9449_t:CDS:1 n=1 Tax=Ambispora gerdemannii TaxID=144530 RepID=A0A9N9BD37_9GLOM|nr:9449_t:CDS:2 [Ambispora gerdemannii]
MSIYNRELITNEKPVNLTGTGTSNDELNTKATSVKLVGSGASDDETIIDLDSLSSQSSSKSSQEQNGGIINEHSKSCRFISTPQQDLDRYSQINNDETNTKTTLNTQKPSRRQSFFKRRQQFRSQSFFKKSFSEFRNKRTETYDENDEVPIGCFEFISLQWSNLRGKKRPSDNDTYYERLSVGRMGTGSLAPGQTKQSTI